jgi:hypothetical protein
MVKVWPLCMSLIVVLALGAGFSGVADAGAGGHYMNLKEQGHPLILPPGTEVSVGLVFPSLGGCEHYEASNKVLANEHKDDAISGGEPLTDACLGEFAGQHDEISGRVSEVQLPDNGSAKFRESTPITISLYGASEEPCVYAFSKLFGTFPTTGELKVDGTALGKLNKAASKGACAHTVSTHFEGFVKGANKLPLETVRHR